MQIIRYQDIGDTLFVIESGEVTVYKNDKLEERIRTLGSGDYFGEKALNSLSPKRTATCIASSRTICFTIGGDQVKRLIGTEIDLIEQNAGKGPQAPIKRQRCKIGISTTPSVGDVGKASKLTYDSHVSHLYAMDKDKD